MYLSFEHTRIRAIELFLCAVVLGGCGRVISLDYEPINSSKGQGPVEITPFQYQALEEHRVRPRQVETNPEARTALFLSQDISSFLTEALRKELIRAGYSPTGSSALTVSGTIRRFYIDWKTGTDRLFELSVAYSIRSQEGPLFTWDCSSLQKGPDSFVEDGILIRKATADCMQRFLHAAQDAKVL
jgi:hypothetical protein